MWGQGLIAAQILERNRIIPTRVGTSEEELERWERHGDHPHACGDKHMPARFPRCFVGSSPRVWGQARTQKNVKSAVGIIPTRVGTSSAVYRKVNSHRDHPHACGDKKRLQLTGHETTGSSPRVWGQAYRSQCLQVR